MLSVGHALEQGYGVLVQLLLLPPQPPSNQQEKKGGGGDGAARHSALAFLVPGYGAGVS